MKTWKLKFDWGKMLLASAIALMVLEATADLPAFCAPGHHAPKSRIPKATTSEMPDCEVGQLILQVGNTTTDDDYKSLLNEFNASELETIHVGDLTFRVVSVDKTKFMDTYKKLQKDTRLQMVALNLHYKPLAWPRTGPPDDPDFNLQPQLFVNKVIYEYAIGAGLPGEGAAGEVMGIIDTGVDANHVDLGGRVLRGINVITGGPGNRDSGSQNFPHGTFIAAEVASTTNNLTLGASENYNSEIFPVDVFNGRNFTELSDIVKGIAACIGVPGLRVINVSLGQRPPRTLNADPVYLKACEEFFHKNDGLVFNASGNSGPAKDTSERRDVNIVVAGVDSNFNYDGFSITGPAVTFAACSVGVVSSGPMPPPDGPVVMIKSKGTSFSAPACAAIAELMFAMNPSLKNHEVLALMKKHSIALPTSFHEGFGIPQADKCVLGALKRI
jgi:hypothetical protein